MTNDYDFAITFFKVKRKINCKSLLLSLISIVMTSLWLLLVSCLGTFVAIMFIYQLG